MDNNKQKETGKNEQEEEKITENEEEVESDATIVWNTKDSEDKELEQKEKRKLHWEQLLMGAKLKLSKDHWQLRIVPKERSGEICKLGMLYLADDVSNDSLSNILGYYLCMSLDFKKSQGE